MRLYRAVSANELADILVYDGFRPIASSLAGKWFAEAAEHAAAWGRQLYFLSGAVFHIVEFEVADSVANAMFRLPNLDQIGPARYAEGELLEALNRTNRGITELPVIALGTP